MRVLTVRQPWAWAIIHGGKDVENRTRNIAGPYRGPVAIHAGLGVSSEAFDFNALMQGQRRRSFEHGAVVGVVDLASVHHCSDHGRNEADRCSRWAMADHWHLALANARPIAPIPAKGRLGLWYPDRDLLPQIREALA